LKHRVLSEHFGKVKAKLVALAEHFGIAEHGDVKGYGREAIVEEFLRSHLPDQVEYLTGEILDPADKRSGQVDIILQSKHQPKIPLLSNIHLAFSNAVIATIEVKSSLTTQHLSAALGSIYKIKRLKRSFALTMAGARSIEAIPCIIFAFTGPTKDTLLNSIVSYSRDNNLPLDQCSPDMVVVLNRDYYICKNDGWQFPVVPVHAPHPAGYFRDWAGLPHENLVGCYNYLNNIIQSYMSDTRQLNMRDYFDKTVIEASDA
jgi:hypothetical protein